MVLLETFEEMVAGSGSLELSLITVETGSSNVTWAELSSVTSGTGLSFVTSVSGLSLVSSETWISLVTSGTERLLEYSGEGSASNTASAGTQSARGVSSVGGSAISHGPCPLGTAGLAGSAASLTVGNGFSGQLMARTLKSEEDPIEFWAAEQSDRVGCCKSGRERRDEPGLAVLHVLGLGSLCPVSSGCGIGGIFSMIYESPENGSAGSIGSYP